MSAAKKPGPRGRRRIARASEAMRRAINANCATEYKETEKNSCLWCDFEEAASGGGRSWRPVA